MWSTIKIIFFFFWILCLQMNEEVGTQINVLFSEQVREKKKEIGIDEEIKSKNSK